MAIRSWTLDGKTFGLTRDDVGADGYPLLPAGEYFKTWPVMVSALVADMAKVVGWRESASASATAAAGSATAAAASAASAATDRATGQQLLTQTQSARDASAASAVLAQQYVGTASNLIVPVINYRLASAWDANGNATAYNLTSVVAVHRYDIRLDWDRGAWRKGKLARQSSWYQETLNTATRGSKREFPVVALIVATSTQLIIYDAHDLDANASPRMWKVFGNASGSWATANVICGTNSSVSAKTGRIVVGDNSGTFGMVEINFVLDRAFRRTSTAGFGGDYRGTLADSGKGYAQNLLASQVIVSATVNAVDLRVLPGAPLDPVSRLPIPTVLIGTAGGASVVHPTGLVVNITGFAPTKANLLPDGRLMLLDPGAGPRIGPMPYASTTYGAWQSKVYLNTASPQTAAGGIVTALAAGGLVCEGRSGGLAMITEDAANPANGMSAIVTKDYATGWMVGETKLAALCEGAGSNGTSGGELVSNGDFSSGTAGWTATNGASLSVVSGELVIAAPGGQVPTASQALTTVIGQTYTVTCMGRRGTAAQYATLQISAVGMTTQTAAASTTSATPLALTFVATNTATTVSMYPGGTPAAGETIIFDNVSCRKAGTFSDAVTGSGELFANPGFDADTVWSKTGGWAITGGKAVKTAGSAGDLTQAVSLIVGQAYVVQYTVSSCTAGSVAPRFYNGTAVTGPSVSANGTYSATMVAVSGNTLAGFTTDTAFNGSIDDVSCKLAIPDRSYKGKGLVVNGTLIRTLLASTSDQYEYSGFSSTTYFDQPYNPDYDPGTGDLMIRFRGGSTVANGYFLDRDSGSGARYSIVANANKAAFLVSDGTNSFSLVSSTDFTGASSPRHIWTVIVRRATQVAEIWCDGVLDASVSCSAIGSLTNTSARLRVGERVASSAPATGLAISMLRIGTYAPTPAQIRRMDADELAAAPNKMMLGGTSNNVQSLALDEDTGVMHVGTADGVSQFAGLRRTGKLSQAAGTAFTVASVTSLSAGGGALLIGTASEAGVVSELMPIKDELRQAPAANSNDIVFEVTTTGATPAVLGKLFVGEGESLLVDLDVLGVEYGLTPTDACSYSIKGHVRRSYGGNVQLPTTPLKIILSTTNAAMDTSMSADTSAQAVSISVTGLAGKTMVWRGTARINRIGGVNAAA